jgi:hypothetical protein
MVRIGAQSPSRFRCHDPEHPLPGSGSDGAKVDRSAAT